MFLWSIVRSLLISILGLPRLRLPSRNWTIFLTIVGSFAGAVIYDKWQTRRVKDKWCKLVSHIAEEPLDTKSLPRRVTLYLAAPPADGLRSAREHFHEYVKPILVAGALDWDAVEGRKEGDVRYKTAERIRRKRKRAGEGKQEPVDEEEQRLTVEAIRENNQTREYDGVAGDIIIGRHTWKEYVRGLHEGWLGPVDAPPEQKSTEDSQVQSMTLQQQSHPTQSAASAVATEVPGAAGEVIETTAATSETLPVDESKDTASQPEEERKKEHQEEEKPKPRHPPPYISPMDYEHMPLSPSTPEVIGPSIAINFPHLLGIRNTPIRIYRFLTRRYLADQVGREVAAAVLAAKYRPYSSVMVNEDSDGGIEKPTWEQEGVLKHEEKDWWKTVHLPRKEFEESVWIEDMVFDERIAGRMRRFDLSLEDEERAKRIVEGTEVLEKRDK